MKDYDGRNYYQWDAQNNYWYDHEWNSANPWQPITISQAANPNHPVHGDVLNRLYNTGGGVGRYDAITASFKNLPNVNEMVWYARQGEPRWDSDELWTTMGHLYKAGMWFLKKSEIQNYSTEHADDGITDWRLGGYSLTNTNINQGAPVSGIENYFYLPALGQYLNGKLLSVGSVGYYWSSSSNPNDNGQAYYLCFSNNNIYIDFKGFRFSGLWVKHFE